MADHSRHRREVESALRATRPQGNPPAHARYHGSVGHEDRAPDEQSRLEFLGLLTGQLDAIHKRGFPFAKNAEESELAEIWDHIWRESTVFEAKSLALAHFSTPKRFAEAKNHWPVFSKWAEQIDNWPHSDTLSKLVAQALEQNPEKVYPTLKKWSRAKAPWLRRQSVVGLLYYSSGRKKLLPLTQILPLVESLLDDPHFYVQKGVGWTLREIYNLWPKEQVAWVRKNAARIPSAGYFAAVKKYPAPLKNEIKALRQEARKKS